MKKRIVILVLVALAVFGAVMGITAIVKASRAKQAIEAQQKHEQQIKEKIIEILNNTPLDPQLGATIGELIPEVFIDYKIQYQEDKDEKGTYIVNITGRHHLSPSVPGMASNGTIGYRVNTITGTCKQYKDDDNIGNVMIAYAVPRIFP